MNHTVHDEKKSDLECQIFNHNFFNSFNNLYTTVSRIHRDKLNTSSEEEINVNKVLNDSLYFDVDSFHVFNTSSCIEEIENQYDFDEGHKVSDESVTPFEADLSVICHKTHRHSDIDDSYNLGPNKSWWSNKEQDSKVSNPSPVHGKLNVS